MRNKRGILDFPRNEPGLVDYFLGSAYDTVKLVADNIKLLEDLAKEIEKLPMTAQEIFDDYLKEKLPELQIIIEKMAYETKTIIEEHVKTASEEYLERLHELYTIIERLYEEIGNFKDEAKRSEENAKVSELNAGLSENKAKESETNSKESELNAKDSEEKSKEFYDATKEAVYNYAKVVTESADFTLDTKHLSKWVRIDVPLPTDTVTVTIPEKPATPFKEGEEADWLDVNEIIFLQMGKGTVDFIVEDEEAVKLEFMSGTSPILAKGGKVASIKSLDKGNWFLYGALEDI